MVDVNNIKEIYTVVTSDTLTDGNIDVVSFSTMEKAKESMKKYYDSFCNEYKEDLYYKYIDDDIAICMYRAESDEGKVNGKYMVELFKSYIIE